MVPFTPNLEYEFPEAFAGMIGDSMFLDKVSVPCGAPTAFGAVVTSVSASGVSAYPTTGNVLEGVALHEHHFNGRHDGQEGYVQGDAMTVGRRGRFWCRAGGACTKDAVAKYDPATGLFSDAGTATYSQAKFLTAMRTVPGVAGIGSQTIVYVELHSPAVAA